MLKADESRQRFETLVARVFSARKFDVEANALINDRGTRREVDLLLTIGDVQTVVEIKTFRTRTPAVQDISRAIDVANRARLAWRADHALLVTNLRRAQLPRIGTDLSAAMIVCIEDLIWFATGNVELISELIESDRELSSALRDFDNPLQLEIRRPDTDLTILKVHAPKPVGGRPLPASPAHGSTIRTGDRLALDLEAIPVGTDKELILPSGLQGVPWRLLEVVGLQAIRFLFDQQFHRWDEQGNAGGEDQRYDVLAKVKGDDVFSSMLVQDFRSRYVLFEFKNYKAPLKPNLIFVTEKYLFPTALRATAIMISPKGLSPEAVTATQGALRDAGKLFLDLPTPKLCDLLRKRDDGTSPDEEMELLLDSFLQKIGR